MDNLFVEFGKLCNFAAISTPRTVLLGLGEGGGSSLIYKKGVYMRFVFGYLKLCKFQSLPKSKQR